MKLLPQLSSLIQKNFSGRLNILYEQNNQFLAYLTITEQHIIHCKYASWQGEVALLELLLFLGSSDDSLTFVEEPELIETKKYEFRIDLEQLGQLLNRYFVSEKLAPPAQLRLVIAGDFVLQGAEITYEEFQLLQTISDYAQVAEIYQKSPLSPAQTLISLVGLRKKGALRVLGQLQTS